jgi:alkanesulfonate monooxygenase SsuD/methylene tetrahydromethanopterin reductase-like flavin-dependent oxidoreductase (luciferase family)
LTHLTIRFDLRCPAFSPATHAELYAACLEQCAWADERGFESVVLSEHHGVEDGYLPSPLVMAGAVAGRTRRALISISALLVPLHDPVRLAEDIAVLDLASGGRVVIVAGIGYRDGEFEMFGVERRGRGSLMESHVELMRRAWTGEPFEHRGHTVTVRPTPVTRPHPTILVGGSTEVAARRAARLRLPFMPAIGDQSLADLYYAECRRQGYEGGWVMLPHGPGFVHVSEDPERAWSQILPHAQYDARTYASWQQPGMRSEVTTYASTPEELRASGVYAVVTPDECVELARKEGSLVFHPLMGGLSPDLGWESLELFASKVLPRLERS